MDANLLGQLSVLQSSYFSFEPGQDPLPLFLDPIVNLVYFCFPPPQLLEHDPLADQSDHWQMSFGVGGDVVNPRAGWNMEEVARMVAAYRFPPSYSCLLLNTVPFSGAD